MNDDSRSLDDLTPLPVSVTPTMTAEEADALLLRNAYDRLKLEYAALQARYQERGDILERMHHERRSLANRIRALEKSRG